MSQEISSLLSAEVRKQIDHWLTKYPADQRRSALLPALHIVQDTNQGWLTEELIAAVADYLEIPTIAAFEAVSFYTMYETKPVGRYKISVCTNISCMLCGCDSVVKRLKERLNIDFNETTPDGKFTIKEVECLAACGGAPAMMINRDYYENLTPKKIDDILDSLK